MGNRIEYEEYQPRPEGIYIGKCIKVDAETGDYGDYLKIEFAILDGPVDGTITGAASAKFSEKSKLYRWSKALCAGSDEGFRGGFDDSLILGKVAKLIVQHAEKDGVVYDRITELLPAKMEEIHAIKQREVVPFP